MKRNTLILASLLTFLLAFSLATPRHAGDGLSGRLGSDPSVYSSRVLLDLLEDEDPDCEQVLRLLLGLGDEEELDGERIVRFLLGIDESDGIDRQQIVRMLREASDVDRD